MASSFVNPFVSGRHQKLVGFGLWLACALALLLASGWFCRLQIDDTMQRNARVALDHFDKTHRNVANAFEELHRVATSEPCSAQFIGELRRVAFKPDGLNEFMYAPGGMVTCSTSIPRGQEPKSLGTPDIEGGPNGVTFWINRRLDDVGLAGVVGSVAYQEPFALVIPSQAPGTDSDVQGHRWMKSQAVVSTAGRVWHIAGEQGIFAAIVDQKAGEAPLSEMTTVVCGETHPHCVAMKADLADIARNWGGELLMAVGLIGFYAVWPASVAHRWLKQYWSLEARFRRNLDAGSIICAYQPILNLTTGEISAVEVLARWRDVDGSVVAPDQFINLVAKAGKTLDFTKMVADRAHAELAEALPEQTRLQVNFNIFPRDLDCEKLTSVFSAFEADAERFSLALEIVESDALFDNAEHQIEALARRGIRTYIDDFGSGYSSIHRVASLAIHGVKLDRSFAMAPKESLMARMLVHALDMIGSSGREIVVEGVETQDRLDLLIESGRVAYAQGYLISRPVPIERLVEFLAAHDPKSALAREELAAA